MGLGYFYLARSDVHSDLYLLMGMEYRVKRS